MYAKFICRRNGHISAQAFAFFQFWSVSVEKQMTRVRDLDLSQDIDRSTITRTVAAGVTHDLFDPTQFQLPT